MCLNVSNFSEKWYRFFKLNRATWRRYIYYISYKKRYSCTLMFFLNIFHRQERKNWIFLIMSFFWKNKWVLNLPYIKNGLFSLKLKCRLRISYGNFVLCKIEGRILFIYNFNLFLQSLISIFQNKMKKIVKLIKHNQYIFVILKELTISFKSSL